MGDTTRGRGQPAVVPTGEPSGDDTTRGSLGHPANPALTLGGHRRGSSGVYRSMTATTPSAEHPLDGTLIRSLYPSLRRLAAVVAPAEVGPDDLLQEAFERYLARSPSGIDNPEAYMRRVIVHTASNHRRRLGRWRRRLQRLAPRSDDGSLDAYPSDVSFLELISPVERAVLFLHHVEGTGFRDIAAELDMTEAAAKQVAARARRRLRAHLNEEATP